MIRKEIVKTALAPDTFEGSSAQAVKAGPFIFLSGQTGLEPSADPKAGSLGRIGDLGGQSERICKNIKAILEAAGTSMDRLVKRTTFLRHWEDWVDYYPVVGKWFTGPVGSVTTGACPLEQDILVTVGDLIAVTKEVEKEIITTPEVAEAFIKSSARGGVKAGPFIFVTGQAAFEPGFDPSRIKTREQLRQPMLRKPADIAGQTDLTMKYVKAIVETRTSMENVVRLGVYLNHPEEWLEAYEVIGKYIPGSVAGITVGTETAGRGPIIEIEAIAVEPGTRKDIICTAGAPGPFGRSAAQAVKAGGFVFVSGQVGVSPEVEPNKVLKTWKDIKTPGKLGELGGVADQADRAMKNIKAILEAAGTSLENVVRSTVYLRYPQDWRDVYEVVDRYYTSPVACVTVGLHRGIGLHRDLLVEIEAVAIAPN